MKFPRMMCRSIAGLVAVILASCATFEESGLPGSAAWMARDKIMVVQAQPPNFGFRRLAVHVSNTPDLQYFVDLRGLPDFLAEAKNRGRQYLILYYLGRREAFACRGEGTHGEGVEFSGPYPITDREARTLKRLREHSVY
ncbi:MAG: hypothetical protein V4733_04985 [Verrucomicrobiota bacterium]